MNALACQPASKCQRAYHCYLCRDGCWIMWPCYGVHITVHGTSCFCTLSASASMHWTISTWARFLFLKSLRLVSVLLIIIFNNLLCGTAHVIVVDMPSAHVCIDKWHPLCSAPSVFSEKIAGVRSQLCSKWSSKGTSSENFLATGGFLNATLIVLRR